MTEADLQASVVELARLLGWASYHTRNSVGSDPGFPDLVLIRPPRLLFAELKVGAKKPTAEQVAWARWLEQVAAAVAQPFPFGDVPLMDYRLWRDTDWLSGQVERELRARAAGG